VETSAAGRASDSTDGALKMRAYFLRSPGLTQICFRSGGKKVLDAEFHDVEISVTSEEPKEVIGFEEASNGQPCFDVDEE
jgi:hypothetical protein